MNPATDALSAHLRKSRYAAQLLEADPALAAELDALGGQPFSRAEMDATLVSLAEADEEAAKRHLRRLRQRVLLRVMGRDLAGLATLAEVCATMSDLAEATIAAASDFSRKGSASRDARTTAIRSTFKLASQLASSSLRP